MKRVRAKIFFIIPWKKKSKCWEFKDDFKHQQNASYRRTGETELHWPIVINCLTTLFSYLHQQCLHIIFSTYIFYINCCKPLSLSKPVENGLILTTMSIRHLCCWFYAAPVAQGELFLLVNHVLLACWSFQECTLLERRTHSCFSHSHVSKAVDFISCWSRHRMLQSAFLTPLSPSLAGRLFLRVCVHFSDFCSTFRLVRDDGDSPSHRQRQQELDTKVAFDETAAKQQQHSCSGINSNLIGTSVPYGDQRTVLMQNWLGLELG